ncbi:galactose-1-phosphate uridylyltransferase [Candidatus Desantisbacteria bacterium CG2_30_40_21]|uniref:Galactose-1-phosphate uridylyltransferase n=5 Tax=unclassified Candidatus Desantisiibacteriota TaxID=3106372 RepID=A0A2M7J8J1_9BACT|nr:MAG: galactose-1-phosphate uridylyltransferase [Candidatus Desantisbacteria bacterium CG2_30_40_21]PIP39481.1 MAG: galactose-1-phosphate uridylyltransferase [Candidatus Desantisbacteria bacterium CG23_combo_of_CG06-09_8_20_14_all_40_23]PIX15717.1 MAG: galactose-1-phosphate uridylyltransferase [Candidatus Desantisbacteria bacterium CG_4_8_14_3_um_filter_40_12]PIY19934.1 MAG: galactose-1-phosphate uridylyltransferase [Candidatus Desantisbacteria bacterium CG_4_10_14_3_um_filter_40_18]PJB29399.
MGELRKDPVVNRWVIINPQGRKRLFLEKEAREEKKAYAENCPFCDGNEDKTPPEILVFREPDSQKWLVRVTANKFPALRIEGELERQGTGIYDQMQGVGAHEVIIDSPSHSDSIADMDESHVEKIIQAYRDRVVDLKLDKRFKYVLVFKNYRITAGASMEHPHSQLIATPIIPKRVKEELKGCLEFYKHKERCLFCDIIREEKRSQLRIVAENDHFLSFTPYASRFPYEICIIPKIHCGDFANIRNEEIYPLAKILKETLKRLQILLDDPPYNYVIHTTPFHFPSNIRDYHWHMEIIPRVIRMAGFEWGTGFYLNPVAPEDAARELREVNG